MNRLITQIRNELHGVPPASSLTDLNNRVFWMRDSPLFQLPSKFGLPLLTNAR